MRARFRNLILFFLCLTYFFVRGNGRKDAKNPKKILVAQLAKLGDMVCATPMFRAVKKQYPQCEVYILGDRVNRELLAGNRDVDGYIVYEKEFWKTRREVKQEKFDAVLLTGPSPEILALLFLSGIPLVVAPKIENGFSPQETRVYKLLLKFVTAISHRMGFYAAREYLRLLEPVGIVSDGTSKYLNYSEDSRKKVAEFLAAHNLDSAKDFLVGIFPSTGYEIKRWPAERFAEVADYMIEKYNAAVVVPGSEGDRTQCEEMVAHMRHREKVVSAVGKFSVDELKALVARMKLFISVDTGPIYIAEAFGVPTVDIVGPMDDREQPPIGEKHKVVKVARKEPQLHVMNTSVFDYNEAVRQRDGITVEMVCEVIDTLIGAPN
ncbi:MAG: glycosyltransferase family 9 protein [Candidatus Sungbacteria bacterium]|nr:glycosyltransferase family 9 protein [Candidatus Sungbacteria bacterium]